jgi:quercetin dioxygenase-like cupin family protein
MSAFGHVSTIPPLEVFPGVRARPVDGERMTFTVFELDPEVAVPEHQHGNEQLGVLISGSLRFRVGEEERELGPGATWCIHSDVPHAVQAGPEGATIAGVFVPGRADWAGREREQPVPVAFFG